MSFTTHNNYEVPDGGVQNWDASLNENFELLELGPTIKATAGITLAVGKVAYMNNSERLMLAISSSGTTEASQFLGFTKTQINQEVDGYVQISGNHKWPHWSFTPGPVYLDASTAGDVTQTEPSISTMVGYAIGTNELVIRPWVDNSFDHGTLTGLVDPADDHTQYLATDNRRSTSGLTVSGTLEVNNGIIINSSGNDNDTQIKGLTDDNLFYVDAGNDRIGIGTSGPSHQVDVSSVINTARYRVNGESFAFYNTGSPSLPGGAIASIELGFAGIGTPGFSTRLNADTNSYLEAYHSGLTTTFGFIGGSVGIGTNTPLSKLHIDQSDLEGAISVLQLDQNDHDESFMEFTGLAVTGGTSSIDLNTGELSAVYGKVQVKINGVTKWIRLYDDET